VTSSSSKPAGETAGSSGGAHEARGGESQGIDVTDDWRWILLLLLGCYHGINPGMGWLFAVALGLQEGRARAVLTALPPIALGHAVSIGLVLLFAQFAQAALPHASLRLMAAALLAGFGITRLLRARHPAWVGMRVGFSGLALWAFLMSSGHGAGLMLLPIATADAAPEHGHASWAACGGVSWIGAVSVHTAGYAVTMLLIALIVYQRLGLAFLRRRWFNLDAIWAVALLGTGAVMFLG
jgi:hypothetical protein